MVKMGLEPGGDDLRYDFVDDIAEGYGSELFGVGHPFLLRDEGEKGGVES
jgi:hypothetical protein